MFFKKKCANQACDNTHKMTLDPDEHWCNACYGKRVNKQERHLRGLRKEQELVAKYWKAPAWVPEI